MSKASCVPRQWLYKRYDFWEHYSQSEILFSDNLADGSCKCGIGRQFFGRSVPPWNSLGSEFEQYRDAGEIFVPRTRTLFSWMRSPPRGPCESDIDCFGPLAPPPVLLLWLLVNVVSLQVTAAKFPFPKQDPTDPWPCQAVVSCQPRFVLRLVMLHAHNGTTAVSLVTSGFEHSPGYAHIGMHRHTWTVHPIPVSTSPAALRARTTKQAGIDSINVYIYTSIPIYI